MQRKSRKHLPTRMYFNRGFYWFVDTARKWHKLGKDEQESLKAYALLLSDKVYKMADLFDRYEREVLPAKAKETQRNQARELKLLRNVFGAMTPSQVKPPHVAKYLDLRANVAGNREIALLSHIFKTESECHIKVPR